MRKGELTRQHIIEKSAPLFNKMGYGASLSDLMKATGLEKGGIYRHFASKEELACEAFDYAFQISTTAKFEALKKLPTGLAKVETLIKNFVEARAPLGGGCPIFNTAVEHDDGNPQLRKKALKAMYAWIEGLAGFIEQAKSEGAYRKDVEAEKLAYFVISTLEGALIARNLAHKPSILADAGAELLTFLETKKI